jgi:hypothetical protein
MGKTQPERGPEKAPDRTPIKVIPICTVDRNRLRAIDDGSFGHSSLRT